MPGIRVRRPSLRVVLIVVGCLVAVGVPLGWSLVDHSSGVRQINPGAAVRIADSTTAPPPTTPPRTTTVPRTTTAARRPSTTAPRTTAAPTPTQVAYPAAAASVPVGLSIPSLSIDAPIQPVGVDGSGEMAIPENIHTIGWYEWGPGPGSASGSIVMAGHVDSARDGLGTFFYLRNLQQGAGVAVRMGNGTTRAYHVVAREEFPKTTVPLGKLFSRSGPERLTLITCGGAFDQQARSYYDNIVVTAVPA